MFFSENLPKLMPPIESCGKSWIDHWLRCYQSKVKIPSDQIRAASDAIHWRNYRPQRSCGKAMFSQASVILFTGERLWQTHPLLADTPLPVGRHPPTATAADGTHPTGMHSCLFCTINVTLSSIPKNYKHMNTLQKLESGFSSPTVSEVISSIDYVG